MNDKTYPYIPDEDFRRRNYDICNAIDLTKLSCVLEEMIKDGSITKKESEYYDKLGDSLRQLLRLKNEDYFSKLEKL